MHKRSRGVQPTITDMEQIELVVKARLELGVTRFQVRGPVSWKSRGVFGPKTSCQTVICFFLKSWSLNMFLCKKNQEDCEVWGPRTSTWRRCKGNCDNQNRPERFRHFWETDPSSLTTRLPNCQDYLIAYSLFRPKMHFISDAFSRVWHAGPFIMVKTSSKWKLLVSQNHEWFHFSRNCRSGLWAFLLPEPDSRKRRACENTNGRGAN